MDIYATLERGTTHWLSRILETGKEPYYFVPTSDSCAVSRATLLRAVNRTYPGVCFVSDALFNSLVQESEVPS